MNQQNQSSLQPKANPMDLSTGIPLEILEKFTIRGGTILNKVFHDGSFAWASNRFILIRTPSNHPRSDDQEGAIEKFSKILEEFPTEDSPLWTSEIPSGEAKTKPCPTCRGGKKATSCPECDGHGEIELDHDWIDHAGKHRSTTYEVDCESCNGKGIIRGGDDDCPDCDGTGVEEIYSPVPFGIHYIDARRLQSISVLPGIQIHPNINGQPFKQIPIRGDGWIGVVMPCRNNGVLS